MNSEDTVVYCKMIICVWQVQILSWNKSHPGRADGRVPEPCHCRAHGGLCQAEMRGAGAAEKERLSVWWGWAVGEALPGSEEVSQQK